MKLKTQIIIKDEKPILASHRIDEGLGSFAWKIISGGGKAADDVAIAAAKTTLKASLSKFAALKYLLDSAGAKKLLLETLERARQTDLPQLFTHRLKNGDLVNFYITPSGRPTTKLSRRQISSLEKAGVKPAKIPSLAAQSGAKAGAKDVAAAAVVNQAAKSIKIGDDLASVGLPQVTKIADDAFEVATVKGSKAVISGEGVSLIQSFKNLISSVLDNFSNARGAIARAKEARDAVLKANPNNRKAALKAFQSSLEEAGIGGQKIQRLMQRARRLDAKFDKLGYHPQLAKGFFKRTRATLSSKEISALSKLWRVPVSVLKDVLLSPLTWIASVAGLVLKTIFAAVLGYLGLSLIDGLISDDVEGIEDFQISPTKFFTHTLEFQPGEEVVVDDEDVIANEVIDTLFENSLNRNITITSKIKIVGPEHAVLVTEQIARPQKELDNERERFEKKRFGPLSTQFNELNFLSPAGFAHLFGKIKDENTLSKLRAAAKISYGEFENEMSKIYDKARIWNALMVSLASFDAATPYITVITTALAKTFPDVGVGGLKLGIFDSEKFARDVADDINSLDKRDWNDIITPLTYQIMLEPGTEKTETFNDKLMSYADNQLRPLSNYYSPKDVNSMTDEIDKMSGAEISELISGIPGDQFEEFIKASS